MRLKFPANWREWMMKLAFIASAILIYAEEYKAARGYTIIAFMFLTGEILRLLKEIQKSTKRFK